MVEGLTKPLAAMSDACDRGNLGLFDNDGSYLIRRDSPEGIQIRALAAKAFEKIAVSRRNGVYGMEMYVQESGDNVQAGPFGRPAR